MATVFEPTRRGFPPVPEVAWVDDSYVAPPTFTDGEPALNKPFGLPATLHVASVGEEHLLPTEEPIAAEVPPSG